MKRFIVVAILALIPVGAPARADAPASHRLVAYYHVPAGLALPGADRDAIRRAAREAAAQWSAVCGLALVETADPTGAHVVFTGAVLSGYLGFTDMGMDGRIGRVLRLSAGHVWDATTLTRVIRHEFGHALGIGHGPPGAAMSTGRLPDGLSPWDAAQVIGLFGPRR